jgi:RHS repeat-associated protein
VPAKPEENIAEVPEIKEMVFDKKSLLKEEEYFERMAAIKNEEPTRLVEFVPNSGYLYKYNGKEYQDELGLNLTAMDYRQYDSALGRFNSIDFLSDFFEDNTPYGFSLNNPLVFSDPTGLCPECEKNVNKPKEGQQYNTSGGATYTYTNGKWSRDGGELQEVVITPQNKENKEETASEGQEGKLASVGVGQPGKGESLIPVWGSGRAAIDHFQNGNYWRGTGYTLLAISDVFLVKAAVTAIGKGLVVGGSKLAASNSGRVFWSGGNLAKTEAANFAAENGMKTLEMTKLGSIMNKLSPHLPEVITTPIWHQLSKNFAKGATGEVNFFTTLAGPRATSIWSTVEKPILESNTINIITHIIK